MPITPEPVWTGNDAYVFLYSCNAAGVPVSNIPIVEYCFFQNCSLYSGIEWEQRPGFGNPIRNIESQDEWDLYHLSVGYFYFKSSTDLNLTSVFNRDAYLYIELFLFGEGRKTNEVHVIKPARAADWRIDVQDNQNVEGACSFLASQYLREVNPLVPLSV